MFYRPLYTRWNHWRIGKPPQNGSRTFSKVRCDDVMGNNCVNLSAYCFIKVNPIVFGIKKGAKSLLNDTNFFTEHNLYSVYTNFTDWSRSLFLSRLMIKFRACTLTMSYLPWCFNIASFKSQERSLNLVDIYF